MDLEHIVMGSRARWATSLVRLLWGHRSKLTAFIAGSYTVIVSTFEAQKHLGPFSLRAESSRRISLEAIPQEGAGMYSKVIKGSWSAAVMANPP